MDDLLEVCDVCKGEFFTYYNLYSGNESIPNTICCYGCFENIKTSYNRFRENNNTLIFEEMPDIDVSHLFTIIGHLSGLNLLETKIPKINWQNGF